MNAAADSSLPNHKSWLRPMWEWATVIHADSARSRWRDLSVEFLQYHRSPLNNGLHALTTPLALVGLQGALFALWPLSVLCWIAYLAVIWFLVPVVIFVPTAGIVLGACAVVWHFQPGIWVSMMLFLVGYGGQDLAHVLASERTFQSSYRRSNHCVALLAMHTLYQVPLVVLACGRRRTSPMRLLVQRNSVHYQELTGDASSDDLMTINTWAQEGYPRPEKSVHFWPMDLPPRQRDAFERLSQNDELVSMILRHHGAGYRVEPVLRMNELYITGPPKQSTSDSVFYMSHVDGPFSFFPGVRLYRCMVAASPNAWVTTHFPMTGGEPESSESYRLQTGQAVA
ncbi:MAG: hypothetical protein AAF989_09055, partial [Planctomycetota bacterium]